MIDGPLVAKTTASSAEQDSNKLRLRTRIGLVSVTERSDLQSLNALSPMTVAGGAGTISSRAAQPANASLEISSRFWLALRL